MGYREEKQKLSGHTSTVRWVKALSSSTVVSASRDTTIRVWDIEIGECTALLEGHTATIRALAAHGDTLVSASYDGDARVWSLEKKECIHVLKGHDKNLYTVVFDGKIIVTGSLDDTARVWDPVSG
jgi:F-box and WD-40 domain protein CDC4